MLCLSCFLQKFSTLNFKNLFVTLFLLFLSLFPALQTKLNEEKSARQKADMMSQEKERQMSMLSVDYRQIQQRLQKLEGEHRQEVDKVPFPLFFFFYCKSLIFILF